MYNADQITGRPFRNTLVESDPGNNLPVSLRPAKPPLRPDYEPQAHSRITCSIQHTLWIVALNVVYHITHEKKTKTTDLSIDRVRFGLCVSMRNGPYENTSDSAAKTCWHCAC